MAFHIYGITNIHTNVHHLPAEYSKKLSNDLYKKNRAEQVDIKMPLSVTLVNVDIRLLITGNMSTVLPFHTSIENNCKGWIIGTKVWNKPHAVVFWSLKNRQMSYRFMVSALSQEKKKKIYIDMMSIETNTSHPSFSFFWGFFYYL